jgi:hypothetical protein
MLRRVKIVNKVTVIWPNPCYNNDKTSFLENNGVDMNG